MHDGQLVLVTVDLGAGEPRFDHFVRQVPAESDDQERRDRREKVIIQRVDFDGRVQELRAGLGQALQQRIQRGRHEVGREAAGHARKRTRNTGERVTARGEKDDAAQRDDENVARVDRRVADDTDENHHRRQQFLRRDVEQCADARRDEARILGDADAEHGDEHGTDRAEGHERVHHAGEPRRECVTGQQVGGELHGEKAVQRRISSILYMSKTWIYCR